jgi:predicted enzyme related to lactoylglutathione lyase
MDFVSIRIITADVARLVAFYEKATGETANWANDDFAELVTPHATLAIGSTGTVGLFGPGSAAPEQNRSVIIEFLVDDVDALYTSLAGDAATATTTTTATAPPTAGIPATEFVNEPTTMPWGNRSLLVRDPDGNLVNFFTPVTPEAVRKFAR